MVQLPRVEGGFGCITSDNPWEYDNRSSNGAAEDHYPTMNLTELAEMPVADVAAKNAHLYLWTTDAHLAQALIVAKLWGFKPKMTMVWVKTKDLETRLYTHGDKTKVGHFVTGVVPESLDAVKLQVGTGNYFRHMHELVLFCTRGRTPARDSSIVLPSVFFAPRSEHSAKPEILQTLAERMSPGPGLELFACRQRLHWTCWGPKAHRGALNGASTLEEAAADTGLNGGATGEAIEVANG